MKHVPIPRSMHIEPAPTPEPPRSVALADSPLQLEVVIVTPELAERWLQKNHPSNRPIAWQRVEAFANDMRAGAWILTHQGIAFDANGYLIDGQHRLHAVVQAGQDPTFRSVRMLVARNEAGSYHDPIDRTGARSIAAILGITKRDTALANLLRMFEAGYLIHSPMTLHEAEAVLERHRNYLEQIANVAGHTKLHGPVLAACAWAWPCDPELTEQFMTQAASGEMIQRGDPAFALRSWLERNKRTDVWTRGMATCTCLRHALNKAQIANVFTGEWAYRSITARRRMLKIPNTPGPEIVPPGHWTPTSTSRGGAE
jgi:hypothetical protein